MIQRIQCKRDKNQTSSKIKTDFFSFKHRTRDFSRIYGHPGAHQCLAWQWEKMRHKKIWNGSTYLFFFFRRDELRRLQTCTNVSLKNCADGGGRELLHPGTISLLMVPRWDFSQLQLFPDEVAVTCGVKWDLIRGFLFTLQRTTCSHYLLCFSLLL